MPWPCPVQRDCTRGLTARGHLQPGSGSQEQAVIYGSSVPSYVSTAAQGEYEITDESQGGPDGRQ